MSRERFRFRQSHSLLPILLAQFSRAVRGHGRGALPNRPIIRIKAIIVTAPIYAKVDTNYPR
jgi:hypothetical protein